MSTELRTLIHSRGLTPAEVARELGVHPSQVTRWCDKRDVPLDRLRPLSRLLNVHPLILKPELADLLDGASNRESVG